jgi:hypothetical protein
VAVVGIDTGCHDEVRAAADAGLTAQNDQFLPNQRERTRIALCVRDRADNVIGGLVGEFRLDWLYVDWL